MAEICKSKLLYGYMFVHPGTKLLFMAVNLDKANEWNFEGSLDWHLLHQRSGIKKLITDLNNLYKNTTSFA
jgi:1,4-alpha-glucan branching enzyme